MLISELLTDIGDLTDYKIHFAKYDQKKEPLDVYLADFDNEWKGWNAWSTGNNIFSRKYIFSLINFYPENNTWLFGGIWEVKSFNRELAEKVKNKQAEPCYLYDIELSKKYRDLIGRLKISYEHKDRAVRVMMEKYFPRLELKEILAEPYSEKSFAGYKNLHVDFAKMKRIVTKSLPEWKNALQIKGIYLLTDKLTNRRYVGQAAGEGGIWQRWSDYVNTYHGGNVGLKKYLSEKGQDYFDNNFTFTLLEIVESNLENDINDRETYWKNVLLSRNPEFGFNEN
ncbi:GIY-YIG nuclease family protein [Succinivibrio dextrinosolvens]|uniref:GIY-YIG nuclease family protein n=1 Tax=Succinivibrio dextrinosolvens TaxID=83771 RepID=UPI00192196F6|nr:GIY-YIG nuclease family protein [Succinivibrio dextrinosolvens]